MLVRLKKRDPYYVTSCSNFRWTTTHIFMNWSSVPGILCTEKGKHNIYAHTKLLVGAVSVDTYLLTNTPPFSIEVDGKGDFTRLFS